MAKQHRYTAKIVWSGATRDYKSYARAHTVEIAGKPPIPYSSDPAFNGDPERHNPEEMLVAALSSCHMLWYLHLCAVKGVVVTSYIDAAEGTMLEEPLGGRFTDVVLKPVITLTPESDEAVAASLHERAHAECFIANSVNFPVRCAPSFVKSEASAA